MNAITNLIPHRDPFLFVDRLLAADQKKTTGERTFPATEWFFKGHFPGQPVVPGVLLVECMAQCGGAGLVEIGVFENQVFFLVSVDGVKLRRPVRPGETLRIEVEHVKVSSRLVKQRGQGWVGDELAVEAEWICVPKRDR